MKNNFLELNAIKVSQPLGDFYITTIKAKDLLKIAFSEELRYLDNGELKGTQRKLEDKRLKEIAQYINSVEMSFPNSIILGANYNKHCDEVEDNLDIRWYFENVESNIYKIIIPTSNQLAAIIDGQHRLFAFQKCDVDRLDTELVCSIFFDLPNSYQAYLFATINGNQKKVDKSIALEQFGFNVYNEDEKSWSPEKFAVYYTRKLNFSDTSPLYYKIKISPKYDSNIITNNWIISTSTMVEGFLSLITSNAKRDRVIMSQVTLFNRNRNLLKKINDKSPLRNLYLNQEDDKIYTIVLNYFNIINTVLWVNENNSYINKTVGVQALFDLLKELFKNNTSLLSSNMDEINKVLSSLIGKVKDVDFTDDRFQASGIGRSRIRNILLYANGFKKDSDFSDEVELTSIKRLLHKF